MASLTGHSSPSSFVPKLNVHDRTRAGRDTHAGGHDSHNLSSLSSIPAAGREGGRTRSDSYRYGNWMTSNNNTTLSGTGTGVGSGSGLVGGGLQERTQPWTGAGRDRSGTSPAPRRVEDWRVGDGLGSAQGNSGGGADHLMGGAGRGSTHWRASRWGDGEFEAGPRRVTPPRWGSGRGPGVGFAEDPSREQGWRAAGGGGGGGWGAAAWPRGGAVGVGSRPYPLGRREDDDGMVASPHRWRSDPSPRGPGMDTSSGARRTARGAGRSQLSRPSSSSSSSETDASSSSTAPTVSTHGSGRGRGDSHQHRRDRATGPGTFAHLQDLRPGAFDDPDGEDEDRATIASMRTNDIDLDAEPVVPAEMLRRARPPIFLWNRHPSHDIVMQLLHHRGIYLPRHRELVNYHMAELFLHYLDVCREGSYFVHYAGNRWPKERFFRIRMLPLHRLATRSESVPQLVVTLHESGVAIVDAIPLDFLVGVTTSPRAPCFRPFLESPDTILGCRDGRGHRSRLPIDGCLTLWFYDRSSRIARSVDILTCDAKIYDVWTKAFMGIVSVNSSSVVQIGLDTEAGGGGPAGVTGSTGSDQSRVGPAATASGTASETANEQRMAELTVAAQQQVEADIAAQARRRGSKRS